MDLGISGKTALVTGAGGGIGRAIALALGAEGARVLVADIDTDSAAQVAAEIGAGGHAAEGIALDVTDRSAIDRLAGDTAIDILVNNAGTVRRVPTMEVTPEQWMQVENVNLFGALHCCQAAMPGMADRGWGRVVNILSLATKMIGKTDTASYAASKAALGGLTRVLAKEFGPKGVTVNAVLPGSIAQTAFNDKMGYPNTTEPMPGMAVPLDRRGTPADVAPVVAFLCGEPARYVTGEFVDVNGGMLMD